MEHLFQCEILGWEIFAVFLFDDVTTTIPKAVAEKKREER